MKVTLMAHTVPCNMDAGDVELFVSSCAKGCYSELPANDLLKQADDKYIKTLKHIVASGHGSVVEHLSFTFCIEGISRACANQLERHRMASYSQQSQRYVEFDEIGIVTPASYVDILMRGDEDSQELAELMDLYSHALIHLKDKLEEMGVEAEDVRYIYPIGMPTNVTVTMNARSLLNFFKWRCCRQAQWEIREVADRMLEICQQIAPSIFENAGAECKRTGCHEGKRGCKHTIKPE